MAVETRSPERELADAASRLVDVSRRIAQDEFELRRLELLGKARVAQRELEAARDEITGRLPALGRGAVRIVLGAVLLALGGLLGVLAIVWALADYVFGFQHVWASFAVVAFVLLLLGVYMATSAFRAAREVKEAPSAAARHLTALGKAVRS